MVIGNGRPEHARQFKEQFGIKFALYVDPEMKAYHAAGLRRGALDALHPSIICDSIRAIRNGATMGMLRGDPWQLGGVFIFEADGALRYRHVNRTASDHPTAEEILDELKT